MMCNIIEIRLKRIILIMLGGCDRKRFIRREAELKTLDRESGFVVIYGRRKNLFINKKNVRQRK